MIDKPQERIPEPTGEIDQGLVRGTEEIFDRVRACPELAPEAYDVLLRNFMNAVVTTGNDVDRKYALNSLKEMSALAGKPADLVDSLLETMPKSQNSQPTAQSDEHLI